MTVEELKIEKAEMEALINFIVQAFEKKTGIYVRELPVESIEVAGYAKPAEKHHFTTVTSKLSFE